MNNMGVVPILIVSLFCNSAHADAVGAEVLLLTAHVSKETIDLGERYRRKLSRDGRFVITPGIELYYDRTLTEGAFHVDSLRLVAAGYNDSVDHFSGYLGILPRWEARLRERLSLSFGLGPVLIFRESWKTVPGYVDDGFYSESEDVLPGYQYKLIIGGDVDLQYRFTPRMKGVWSIVPGIPYVITQSFGIRWSF